MNAVLQLPSIKLPQMSWQSIKINQFRFAKNNRGEDLSEAQTHVFCLMEVHLNVPSVQLTEFLYYVTYAYTTRLTDAITLIVVVKMMMMIC